MPSRSQSILSTCCFCPQNSSGGFYLIRPLLIQISSGTVFTKVLGVSSVEVTIVVEGCTPLISFSEVPHVLCSLLESSAPGKLLRDPSGVTSRVESILMSSCLGCVGVKCLHTVEYYLGMSSPGSPLFHSFLLNIWASSKAARLGVILEVGSWIESRPACPICLLACSNIW